MRAKISILVFCGLAALACMLLGGQPTEAGPPKSRIVNTKHDFSLTSSTEIRAGSVDESCLFCHTPHMASPNVPLWNHTSSSAEFAVYQSSTIDANVSQPSISDSSKLCLSCHDGTIALGDTVSNGDVQFLQGSDYRLGSGSEANIAQGAGYANDHPFAMSPVNGSELRVPHSNDAVRLDGSGKVQCTSCHDPHVQNNDTVTRKFLVMSNARSALCMTCHAPTGWEASSHRQPADASNDARYTSAQGAHTGYTGVANNGCESCHRPHSAQVAERLLKYAEENTCFKCHNGSVAESGKNLQADLQNKVYRHPISTTPSVHDASEGPLSSAHRLPETSPGAERHAECADCHNPHASNPSLAVPPSVKGSLAGVSGVTAGGAGVAVSQFEYQVCLKCHGDSANKPQVLDDGAGAGFGRNPRRQSDVGNPGRFNARLEFTSTVSAHPVVLARGLTTGTGGEVPSLRAAPIGVTGAPLPGRTLSANSLVYCTDCHNSDTGANRGAGAGPAGPHGSSYMHLLERSYTYNTPPPTPGAPFGAVPYSTSAYALCDKCHDVGGSIVQNQSFAFHGKHVVEAGTSCSTCHDSHGVNGTSESDGSSLMNFDLSMVGPDARTGLIRYRKLGFRRGECYLTCHGVSHSPKVY
jgi:predicted CXXCH cytochrome family protein